MDTYKIVKGVAKYSTDILFRQIQVLNAESIPATGPLIIYGNHNNQFVDGMVKFGLKLVAHEGDSENHQFCVGGKVYEATSHRKAHQNGPRNSFIEGTRRGCCGTWECCVSQLRCAQGERNKVFRCSSWWFFRFR